jgi:glutamate synthase (NADPH/NADH) small chain
MSAPLNPLRPAERMRLPRQEMPVRSAGERRASFAEVEQGFDAAAAHGEALRCLACPTAACVHACPVEVDVRAVVDLVLAGDLPAAAAKLREDNALPAVTGRVCPQADQCEGACVLGKRGAPLAIGALERFVADAELASGRLWIPANASPTGKRVAVVGSGPAGLAAAGDLVRRGHGVRVFEALHEPGGVLVYGIPEFRLPKAIVRREIAVLAARGVEFETDVLVGRTLTVDELLGTEGYDAVFLATGAGLPRFLSVPGEDLNGVCSANELLTRVNLLGADRFPEHDEPPCGCRGRRVVVVGGGNTALDAARTALRLGAAAVTLLYRRRALDMPARAPEVRHAREEGIAIEEQILPVEFLGDEQGTLTGVRCIRMAAGPPDATGRPSFQPIPGSEHERPADLAVLAVGTGANPTVQATTPGLAVDRRGHVLADPETLATSRPGVYAGGDLVTGAATVILAMGAGRRAARSIDGYLAGVVGRKR